MGTKKKLAYKAFDKDFKCRDFQYKVGEKYETDEPIKLCENGFHASEMPFACDRLHFILLRKPSDSHRQPVN